MGNSKYIHFERVHNMNAPSIIVPILMDLFSPSSVADIGCGTGTFLKAFSQKGVEKIKGLDGKWVNKQLLFQNVAEKDFHETDLEMLEPAQTKFDLAICLEVGEHLSPSSAAAFISALATYSDVIVFSAALPDQGGQNHINEQWPSYWQHLFKNNGFEMFDVIRAKIWEDKIVDYWYKQNIFVFMKGSSNKSVINIINNPENKMTRVIHPDLFQYKSQYLERILEGKYTFKGYMKMLLKYFLNFFKAKR